MVKKGTPYVNNYIFSEANYYIHQHVQNIGLAGGQEGRRTDQGELVRIFSEKRQSALEAAKTQYKNLFKSSVISEQTSPEGIALIDEALENDDIMREINSQMGKYLFQSLAVEKMAALMEKEISIDKINFNKIINEQAVVDIEEFNKLLQALEGASKLIRNSTLGKRLAFYLSNVLNSKIGTINRADLGLKLQQQLKAFEQQANGSQLNAFDIAQINNISSSLNGLVRTLKTGKKGSSKQKMTARGTKELIQGIFNTGFAQSISGELKKSAYVSIVGGIENVKFTGADTTQIALTDTLGHFQKFVGKPSYGKADVIFPNVKVQLTKQGQETSKEIHISIGISDKFYKGAKFPGVQKIKKQSSLFSSGAGGKLTDVLTLLFGNNVRNLYLSYNTLAHGPKITAAQEALQDIILKRNLVYSFAARGTSDFAQFMFVNGQIIPIWDIILSAENFIGKSASVLKKTGESSPIFLHMENRENMLSIMNPPPGIDDEYTRVSQVNAAMRAIKIKAQLNLNALIELGGKVFSKFS